jgi:hypothetical protein
MERLVHSLFGEASEALVANAEAFAALCVHPPPREELELGERPMSITWQLEVSMPAAMYTRAKVAAG